MLALLAGRYGRHNSSAKAAAQQALTPAVQAEVPATQKQEMSLTGPLRFLLPHSSAISAAGPSSYMEAASVPKAEWQQRWCGQRPPLQAAGSAVAATRPLQGHFSAFQVDEPRHSSRREGTGAVALAARTVTGAATVKTPPAAEDAAAAATPATVAGPSPAAVVVLGAN